MATSLIKNDEDKRDVSYYLPLTLYPFLRTCERYYIKTHVYFKINLNRLLFYLKGTQMIVMKPDNAGGAGQAWLLTKVSNYGQTSN